MLVPFTGSVIAAVSKKDMSHLRGYCTKIPIFSTLTKIYFTFSLRRKNNSVCIRFSIFRLWIWDICIYLCKCLVLHMIGYQEQLYIHTVKIENQRLCLEVLEAFDTKLFFMNRKAISRRKRHLRFFPIRKKKRFQKNLLNFGLWESVGELKEILVRQVVKFGYSVKSITFSSTARPSLCTVAPLQYPVEACNWFGRTLEGFLPSPYLRIECLDSCCWIL